MGQTVEKVGLAIERAGLEWEKDPVGGFRKAQAAAAIEALRHPTDEMIDALYGPYISLEAEKSRRASFGAMIDVVLAEPTKESAS